MLFKAFIKNIPAMFTNFFETCKIVFNKLWKRFKKWAIIRSKISKVLWRATFKQWKRSIIWLYWETIYLILHNLHLIEIKLRRKWKRFYRFETLKQRYFWRWVFRIAVILFIIYYKNFHDKFTYKVILAIMWVIFFTFEECILHGFFKKPDLLTRSDIAIASTDETNLNVEYMPYSIKFDYYQTDFLINLLEPINFDVFVQQIFTFNFLLVLIFLFNINFFLRTKCHIKSLFSAIINLFLIVILASLIGNEPIAYLFLVTELTGIIIISVIVLKQLKEDYEPSRPVLKKILITITLLTSLTWFFKSRYKTDLEEYIYFKTEYSVQNNNYNDLVSLFYTFIIDNQTLNTFIFVFLFLTMLIISCVSFNKKYKKKIIKFNYLKKKIAVLHRDINKKYKEYYNNLTKKFRNKK